MSNMFFDRLAVLAWLFVTVFAENSDKTYSALLTIAFAVVFVGDCIYETRNKSCSCSHD